MHIPKLVQKYEHVCTNLRMCISLVNKWCTMINVLPNDGAKGSKSCRSLVFFNTEILLSI